MWLVPLANVHALRLVGVPLPTQAVINYDAPNASSCTIEASHDSNFASSIHDVNPSLFVGSNSDLLRPSTLVKDQNRTVILGAETSDESDGVFYSRALFAEKAHYVRVTCGASSTTLSFVTPAPPVGELFAKVPPFNPDAWGNHAWPTIDPTSQTAEYADPMSGLTLRLATKTGEYVRHDQSTVLFESYTGGTGWTSPENILAFTASTFTATSSTNVIVLYPDARPNDSNVSLFGHSWGGLSGSTQIDDFGVFAYAEATGSGADAQFAVCRTIDDGATCYGPEITVEADTDASGPINGLYNTSGKITANYPTPFWSDWGGRGIPMEYNPSHGWPYSNSTSVTVTAGVAVLSAGNATAAFSTTLDAGSKIFIDGSSPTCTRNICTIASWDSPTQVTLAETGLSVSNKEYYTLSWGTRFRKITSTGTLRLSAGFRAHGSQSYSNGAAMHRYNLNGFTSGDGKPGRLCILNTSGAPALMFCADDGTVRLVSIGRTTSSANDAPLTVNETHISGFATWHPTDPKVFYVITLTNMDYPGHNSVYRVTYSSNASTSFVSNCGPSGNCIYSDDFLTWENLTPPSTGDHLHAMALEACPAAYTDHVSFYGTFDVANVSSPGSGKYGILHLTYAGQDRGPAWYLIIDVTTTPPEIVKCHHSLNGDTSINNAGGSRWSSHHAMVGVEYPAGTFLFSSNPLDDNNADEQHSGPFQTQFATLLRSGVQSSDTSLPWPEDSTYDRACPSDIDQRFKDAGAVGNVCATFRGKMPCWLNAPETERDEFPCSWAPSTGSQPQLLVPGDNIIDQALTTPFASEHMKLVKVTLLSGDDYEFVFHRDSSSDLCSARHGENNASRNTHADNWTAYVAVTGDYACDGGYLLYRPESDTYAEIGKYIGTGHTALGRSLESDDLDRVSFVTNSPGSIRDSSFSGLTGYPPDIVLYRLAGFNDTPIAGGFGGSQNSGYNIQSYMKRTAVQANGVQWAIDGGAISPNLGGGNEDGVSTTGDRAITLQSGTTDVYKIGLIGTLRNIKHAPLLGWAGRYLLQEKSSPTTDVHTLTDADTWKFCFAYKAGECRTGSSANDIYVNVPKADTGIAALVGQSYKNVPVVVSGFPIANWSFRRGMKQEVNGDGIQRLTQLLGTAAGHYSYTQTVTDPKGIWGLNSASGWRQGEHLHALLTKLPTYEKDSVNRAVFQNIPVGVPAYTGATHARLKFGRNDDFECMPRSEACVTDTVVLPYAFVTSDAPEDPTSCASGCTINLPATSGIWYYQIEWMASDAVVHTGPVEILPVL